MTSWSGTGCEIVGSSMTVSTSGEESDECDGFFDGGLWSLEININSGLASVMGELWFVRDGVEIRFAVRVWCKLE